MEALPLIVIALALAFLGYTMAVLCHPSPYHFVGAYKAHDLVDPLSTFKNRNQTFPNAMCLILVMQPYSCIKAWLVINA